MTEARTLKAQGYLINNGYEILETNFHTRRGEVDIIAKKDNCIVFVEVKTRTNLKDVRILHRDKRGTTYSRPALHLLLFQYSSPLIKVKRK